MPGRGPQTFKKRQKEQERKERQQEKMAKRLQRKADRANGVVSDDNESFEENEPVMDGQESPEPSPGA